MYNIAHNLNIQPEYIFLQPILQIYTELYLIETAYRSLISHQQPLQ